MEKRTRVIADSCRILTWIRPVCGMSNYKYPELPSDPYDVDVWMAAAIRAEECAIGVYRELYRLTHGADPVTAELAEEVWLMGSGVGRS